MSLPWPPQGMPMTSTLSWRTSASGSGITSTTSPSLTGTWFSLTTPLPAPSYRLPSTTPATTLPPTSPPPSSLSTTLLPTMLSGTPHISPTSTTLAAIRRRT
ncbi:hypothetical protein GWK47_042555 [Chionoecetes opilio]|uniref:Uncharacterized protein n=1 Tax=Chionoecetes opilio TaxID=41210 RepID=A0A8J5CWM7_CHIOP|nr:hypothetical protein GWK47_042555 [Chionoecetes opilio]